MTATSTLNPVILAGSLTHKIKKKYFATTINIKKKNCVKTEATNFSKNRILFIKKESFLFDINFHI